MCGIFGYVGVDPATPHLITGLKRMEYRGYDSAGLAVHDGEQIAVIKRQGKVKNLANAVDSGAKACGTVGIAHTRWATHGKPSDTNAHPQINRDGSIAVVHNGIIENYATLKAELVAKGYEFKSETDTELLAHLVEDVARIVRSDEESTDASRWPQIIAATLHLVTGTYGVVFMFKELPDTLIAARKGSPLILGVGKDKLVVASDAAALVGHAEEVLYLNDGEMAILEKSAAGDTTATFNFKVRTIDRDECIPKNLAKLELSLEEIEKGGYKHFMLKEIFDQPNCLNNTLRGRLFKTEGEAATKPDSVLVEESAAAATSERLKIKLGGLSVPLANRSNKTALEILSKARRVIITACGTSWHSALIGEYLIEQYAQTSVEVEYASEFRYRDPILDAESDVVIAISQSGETADTLEAVRLAKSRGVLTLGVVNVVGSSIARETEAGVYLHAGPEIGVASTKAFTSQVMVLVLMALAVAEARGRWSDETAELLQQVADLPGVISRTLAETNAQIQQIAKYFRLASNFLFLGRGISFPVALEAALKLKEISYIHAEGYPAAEMKHGPIALIDALMPVVVIAAKTDPHYDKIKSNVEQVRARGGELIIITQEGNEEFNKMVSSDEYVVKIPATPVNLVPLVSVVPLQLLAYYIADMRGCNIDMPRNLAKSVTVE